MPGSRMNRRLRLRFGVARRVRADVTEGTLAAGHVRGPRLEIALADQGGHLADGLFRPRRLLRRRALAPGQAGLEEAQLDPVREAARRAQVRERVHVELKALLRALPGFLRIVDRARLEVEDGDAAFALDHEVVPALHLRTPHEE